MAAISTSSSSIFTSSTLTFHSSSSISSSVKYKRVPVSAAYATTAERTNENETVRSLRNTCSSSLYEVLGVRIGADTRQVKSAYRKLARILHPDVGTHDSSADEFMKLHSAYVTLMDPEKRAEYDTTLFTMRSTGGYKTRRWETDQCW